MFCDVTFQNEFFCMLFFQYHQDSKLQAGALFAISNIVHRRDSWSKERYMRLTELDIIQSLLDLHKKASTENAFCEDYIYRTLKQIVSQCKKYGPDISK